MLPETTTLRDARAFVLANRADGVECPCCTQLCKLYRRKLNSNMAGGLCWLVRTWLSRCQPGYIDEQPHWVYLPGDGPRWLIKTGGQFSVLEHWGLIEHMPNDDVTKRCSGYWRPTELAINFVQRRCAVPSHVFLFNNTVEGWSDKQIDVDEALNNVFDYQELMDGGYST